MHPQSLPKRWWDDRARRLQRRAIQNLPAFGGFTMERGAFDAGDALLMERNNGKKPETLAATKALQIWTQGLLRQRWQLAGGGGARSISVLCAELKKESERAHAHLTRSLGSDADAVVYILEVYPSPFPS